jgi:hypothetical protein
VGLQAQPVTERITSVSGCVIRTCPRLFAKAKNSCATLSADFIKKKNGLFTMAKHAMFSVAPRVPFTRCSLPKILFTISASSNSRALTITAADVLPVDSAIF